MTRLILSLAARRIPQREIRVKKSSHPWLNDRVLQLVDKKHAAQGSVEYDAAVQECSKGIM
jgi:hypothetical protein